MLSHLDIMTQWPTHQVIDTYVYYDQPLLYSTLFFDAHEDAHWALLQLVDSTDTSLHLTEIWLATRMSNKRKDAVSSSRIPLRDAITQAEDNMIFRITVKNGDVTQVESLHPDQLSEDDLPVVGVTLAG